MLIVMILFFYKGTHCILTMVECPVSFIFYSQNDKMFNKRGYEHDLWLGYAHVGHSISKIVDYRCFIPI